MEERLRSPDGSCSGCHAAPVVGAGDRLRVTSSLEEPEDFEGFAYRAYLARQGVAAIASSRGVSVIGHELGPVADALHGARSWLLSGLNRLVPEPEAALAAGILLGVRAGIDPAINDAFARAGLTHVVAISGWNIAIVAAIAAAAARPLTRLPSGRWLAAAAAMSAVAAYVLLTGASPSVVRAALMAGALLVARLGGARSHAMSALMLAALLMLLASPAIAWDVGFQLSALATAGLIWFGASFAARLRRWPALVREPVALTMAAQVTTLPVILLNFERLSMIAPAANVLVVPLVPLVMLGSALASVAGAAGGALPLADVVEWLSGGIAFCLLRAMVVVGQAAAAVPLASVELTGPPWLAAAWYPALFLVRGKLAAAADRLPGTHDEVAMASGLLARLARPLPLALAAVLLVGGLTLASRPDGRLHLFALDIGQGDAILVVAPTGETALIDGGPDPDLTLRRLGERLPFWQRRLDVLVLTHPHEDHLAGLLPALERFQVGMVIDPGRAYDNPSYPRFLELADDEPDAVVRQARAGDVIRLGPDGPSSNPPSEPGRPCRSPAGGRHQQCVGGAAGGEPRIPGVADWGCGGARRAPPAGARPAERGRRAQGRASRLRLEHAAGDAGRSAPGGRAHLLRRGQRVRPPACRHARAPGRRARPAGPAHRPGGHAGGGGRWRRHRRRRPRTA